MATILTSAQKSGLRTQQMAAEKRAQMGRLPPRIGPAQQQQPGGRIFGTASASGSGSARPSSAAAATAGISARASSKPVMPVGAAASGAAAGGVDQDALDAEQARIRAEQEYVNRGLNRAGGQRMKSGDGKSGFVYTTGTHKGMTTGQATEALRDEFASKASGSSSTGNTQTEDLRHTARGGAAPVTTQSALSGQTNSGGRPHVFGPSPHANARFNAMGDADAARMDSARAAVQRVQAAQKQAEVAATGVHRAADGTVTTRGGGTITTGPGGQKVLTSKYGSGSNLPPPVGVAKSQDNRLTRPPAQVSPGAGKVTPAAGAAVGGAVGSDAPRPVEPTTLGYAATGTQSAPVKSPTLPASANLSDKTVAMALPKPPNGVPPGSRLETPIQTAGRVATDAAKFGGGMIKGVVNMANRNPAAVFNAQRNVLGKAVLRPIGAAAQGVTRWATTPRPVQR